MRRIPLLLLGGYSLSRVARMHGEDVVDGFAAGCRDALGEAPSSPKKRGWLDRWELRNAERDGFDPVGQQIAAWKSFTSQGEP